MSGVRTAVEGADQAFHGRQEEAMAVARKVGRVRRRVARKKARVGRKVARKKARVARKVGRVVRRVRRKKKIAAAMMPSA